MTLSCNCIDVAVALPVYNTFTYSVPEGLLPLISVGKRVLVPFGRRHVTGYILGGCRDDYPKETKNILDVLDEMPLFPSSMLPFFNWVAEYYMHPIGDVIKSALPGGLNLYDFVFVSLTEEGEQAFLEKTATPLETRILALLKKNPCRFKDLAKALDKNIPYSLIYAMEQQGLIVSQRKFKGGTTKPKMERYVSLGAGAVELEKVSGAKQKVIDAISSEGEMSVRKLKAMLPSASKTLTSLAQDGYLSILNKKLYRDPFGEPIRPDTAHVLTGEQKEVIAKVSGLLGKGYSTCLLTGVTGSGKTEVYLQLAAEALKQGFSVLVLVPEIALISQMERRFRARFGDFIAVLHSGLSAGERYDQWLRITRQEATIVIGARSAIFAPFESVGAIIVDEEHDTSYKQESGLRYNARDLAVVRAKLQAGVALLGSATPSIQSYHNVTTKKFREVTLKHRIEKRPLPKIEVIDLRQGDAMRGARRFITPPLHKAMEETLKKGEQVLLFLNRRGFASYPVCAACGQAVKCKHCDISLTLHQAANAYKCHYCGFTLPSMACCAGCGSPKIMLLGLGTEKIEKAVKTLFPFARVARMDRDTTSKRGSILKILKGLRNRTIDVLVGTQMVAKGHDFPNITLVGVICADLSLSFPDFRACERTFQLLAQVAGRAGRGEIPGRVFLQTYNPDHFSITSATRQDFKQFYHQEIRFRKELEYPPFSRMVLLKISGKDEQHVRQHARTVGDLCVALRKNNADFHTVVEVLGPIEAAVPRIAKHYRWQIILKGLRVKPLHRFLHRLLFESRDKIIHPKVKVMVDIDPFFMM